MIVTKEYCDRCGKEVKSEPSNWKLFPIMCKFSKYYFCFSRKREVNLNVTKEVCEECYKEFLNWWFCNKKESDCILGSTVRYGKV